MKYDIAIVGGGLVGASFACALQNSFLRVALIDAAHSHAEDHRLIALNYASCIFLKKLNLWSKLSPHATPIQEVHVSNRRHFGTTRLTAEEMNLEQLGHVIPAKKINAALYEKLTELKHVDLLRGAKVTSLTQNTNEANLTIQLESGQEAIEASLVVAADGTFSTIRELLQIPTDIVDYQQKALVTITTLQRDHRNIAYERFLKKGTIAMLPLTDQRVATIWSGDEKYIDELLALSDADFLEKLQDYFGFRLGKLVKTEARYSYPLKFLKAKEQIKNRVILIGNAAHTVHPIAAQGLNLALYETAILSEHLNQQSPDELTLAHLPDYLPQQTLSMNVSHQLTQLFSMDFFVINAARQLGMIGLDLFMPLKRHFAKQVLGLVRPRVDSSFHD
jgi:2-octaprenyl-6-methoxyphenol hydroxylase